MLYPKPFFIPLGGEEEKLSKEKDGGVQQLFIMPFFYRFTQAVTN